MKTLNEAKTRYLMIDPAVTKAGWNLGNRSQFRFEIPVDGEDADLTVLNANHEVVMAIAEGKIVYESSR
jgi:predicted type IV restriction endonuclease